MSDELVDPREQELSDAFWASLGNLSLDLKVEPDETDPLWVDTSTVRGEFNFDRVMRRLGMQPRTRKRRTDAGRQYVLFAGHIGCGKSTELRRFMKLVDHAEGYSVVYVDSYQQLDPNNLQYVDVLIALAHELCEHLTKTGITLDSGLLKGLENWFREHIVKITEFREATGAIETGGKAGASLPLIGSLFAKLSAGLKGGATYKDELRLVVRNTFSEFSRQFNQLIKVAEEALADAKMADKILFVVDGTDKLNGDDTRRFFIDDVHQLKQIEGNFIYTTRINILSETDHLQTLFSVAKIPMIKIHERHDTADIADAFAVLRELVYKRVDPRLFDDEDTVDYLIRMSGGHPRDLLRLLNYAFQSADESERFDRATAERAVMELATDYRRLLTAEDYATLAEVDVSASQEPNPSIQRLLQETAILEYNSYWWRSHPVIRTLDGYKAARAAADAR